MCSVITRDPILSRTWASGGKNSGNNVAYSAIPSQRPWVELGLPALLPGRRTRNHRPLNSDATKEHHDTTSGYGQLAISADAQSNAGRAILYRLNLVMCILPRVAFTLSLFLSFGNRTPVIHSANPTWNCRLALRADRQMARQNFVCYILLFSKYLLFLDSFITRVRATPATQRAATLRMCDAKPVCRARSVEWRS